jgi:phosphoribosyl-AMP cyclohydrolase / phosphoribosyl-ATP pyrophosphohydrolase
MTVKIAFDLQKIDWEKSIGLIPAIVQSARDNRVLMLGYMNKEALHATLKTAKATFYSRSKARLWVKGETSGNYLNVDEVILDCDCDTLLLRVHPSGPCCHLNTQSCFGCMNPEDGISFLNQLEHVIDNRLQQTNTKSSYVARLAEAGMYKITRKIDEEALEVVLATIQGNKQQILEETADLLFHMLINLRHQGLELKEVVEVLNKRHQSAKP